MVRWQAAAAAAAAVSESSVRYRRCGLNLSPGRYGSSSDRPTVAGRRCETAGSANRAAGLCRSGGVHARVCVRGSPPAGTAALRPTEESLEWTARVES